MAMSNTKSSSGRTPPFVLVALLLLVIILAYNYWVLSSSNRNLTGIIDKMSIESKDTAEKRVSVEKNLEAAREELQVVKGNLDQSKKTLQDRETELNTLRAEQKKIQDESKTCKESMAKCDTDLQTEKKNSENLAAEKTKLEADLKGLKEGSKVECTMQTCQKPVQEVLVVASKLLGTDAMSKALTDAKLDGAKLMEGIAKVDPPAPKEANPVPVASAVAPKPAYKEPTKQT